MAKEKHHDEVVESAIADEPVETVTPCPTLAQAFATLCQALMPLLDEDMVSQCHCADIQGWHADGTTVVAWQHAIRLLEGVLGQRLTSA